MLFKTASRRKEKRRRLSAKPMPHADYFCHKCHCDRNKKLVMFGATYICGMDSFSGKVVGFVTISCFEIIIMPIFRLAK